MATKADVDFKDPVELVPLGLSNIVQTWRMAARIFVYERFSVLGSYIGSLLPHRILPKEVRNNVEDFSYYAAYKNGNPVGISGLFALTGQPKEAWVGYYGVDPDHRNRGLGQEILEATIALARKQGYETLRLWTEAQSPETAAANRLYQRMGFAKQETGLINQLPNGTFPLVIYSVGLTDKGPLPYQGDRLKPFTGSLSHIAPGG